MKIKYPINVKTAAEKTAFLYRLYELLRLDGNLNSWNSVRETKHDLIMMEILKYRGELKKDIQNIASLGDFE